MKQTKHTPGPWRIGENAMGDPHTIWAAQPGMSVGGVFDSSYGEDAPPRKQANANARLIAAAPELLDALVLVERIIEKHRLAGTDQNPKGFRDIIGAAIAKARG